MKLENMRMVQDDDANNVLLDCTVTNANKSNVTAVKANSFFSVETPDGFVLQGGNYPEDICLAPNDVHELTPYARTHLALVMPNKTVRISASMVFYQVALNKEFDLKIDEDPTCVNRFNEMFSVEKNKGIFNLATWVVSSGKVFDIRFIASLSNEIPMPEFCGDLSLELLDASGKTLETSTPTANSAFGGTLIWSSSFWGGKKKDLKGLTLKISLKVLSVIAGSEGSVTELVNL
jgi:hypothetical protein